MSRQRRQLRSAVCECAKKNDKFFSLVFCYRLRFVGKRIVIFDVIAAAEEFHLVIICHVPVAHLIPFK